MSNIPWSELTPALWSIIAVTIMFWIATVLMIVYLLVPSFRGTRVGRFISNNTYRDYIKRTEGSGSRTSPLQSGGGRQLTKAELTIPPVSEATPAAALRNSDKFTDGQIKALS